MRTVKNLFILSIMIAMSFILVSCGQEHSDSGEVLVAAFFEIEGDSVHDHVSLPLKANTTFSDSSSYDSPVEINSSFSAWSVATKEYKTLIDLDTSCTGATPTNLRIKINRDNLTEDITDDYVCASGSNWIQIYFHDTQKAMLLNFNVN